jgi:WD40 repeat protein
MAGDPVEQWSRRAARDWGFKRTRRHAARRLAGTPTPAAAEGLALAATDSGDDEVVAIAMRAFKGVTDQEVIDKVCMVWWGSGVVPLRHFIIEQRWVASQPADRRVETALWSDQPEALAEDGRDTAFVLLTVAHRHSPWFRERARAALSGLVSPEARDAVYAKALQDDEPLAREIALGDGFIEDPSRRALLLFLSGDFDRLAELDFDGRLLAAIHTSADESLRARITAQARASSRVEWVRAVTGAYRSGSLSNAEWSAAVDILTATGRWDELWQLAIQAPPVRGAAILRDLGTRRWAPGSASDAHGFEHLASLAEACTGEPDLASYEPDSMLLDGEHGSGCLTISPDGRLVAVGGQDGAVRLWRLPSGEPAGVLEGHIGEVVALAFAPGGGLLASGGTDSKVRLWRLPSGAPAGVLEGHRASVTCLAIDADGQRLVSGSADRSARVWSLPSGKFLAPLEGHRSTLAEVAFGTFDHQIACNSEIGPIRLWGSPAARLEGAPERAYGMTITPDGRLLLCGDQSGAIRIWHLPSGDAAADLTGHDGPVLCLALSADGEMLAGGGDDGTIRLWHLPSRRLLGVLTGHDEGVCEMRMTPDGRLLASVDYDGTARLWSLPSGTPTGVLHGHEGGIDSLTVSPDGACLVSGSWVGEERFETTVDGRRVFTGLESGTVRLWTAGVTRIVHTPVPELRPADIARIRSLRERTASEPAWLDFAEALVGWRHRHDVEVGDAAAVPDPADIEIEQ